MADRPSNRVSGKASLPIGSMAKSMLGKIFPNLTSDQVTAIRAGQPVPPSPDWAPSLFVAPAPLTLGSVTSDPVTAAWGDTALELVRLNKALDERLVLLRKTARDARILRAVAAAARGGPKITAILVFDDKRRMRLARKAVNQFVAQSYPHKQLVVVNASGTPVTTHPHPEVEEHDWPLGAEDALPTVGAMRNAALDRVEGELVYPFWDDDDVYDPHLLTYLAAHVRPGTPGVVCTAQVRVHYKDLTAHTFVDSGGIPNTMLLRYDDATRFLDATGGEDADYLERHRPHLRVVDTAAWPLNTLRMCVYHGENVAAAGVFMGGRYGPEHAGKWYLSPDEADHVQAALAQFGLTTKPVPVPDGVGG